MKRGTRGRRERRKIGKDRGDEKTVEPFSEATKRKVPVCCFTLAEFSMKLGMGDSDAI